MGNCCYYFYTNDEETVKLRRSPVITLKITGKKTVLAEIASMWKRYSKRDPSYLLYSFSSISLAYQYQMMIYSYIREKGDVSFQLFEVSYQTDFIRSP